MDPVFLLIVVALIVAIVLFVVSLRSGRAPASSRQEAAAPQLPHPPLPAPSTAPEVALPPHAPPAGTVLAPAQAAAPPAGSGNPQAVGLAGPDTQPDALQQTGIASSTVTETPPSPAVESPSPVPAPSPALPGGTATTTFAPVRATSSAAPAAPAAVPSYQAQPDPTPSTQAPGSPTPAGVHGGPLGGSVPPPLAPSDALPVAVPAPAADGSTRRAGGELVDTAGQPRTRSGTTGLMLPPQRLPYRLAELVGEQRQLEEAITVAHRRIDATENDGDAGSADQRIRLTVLREDRAQKQERLREIVFLQDGYHWVQQQMAPGRALPADAG